MVKPAACSARRQARERVGRRHDPTTSGAHPKTHHATSEAAPPCSDQVRPPHPLESPDTQRACRADPPPRSSPEKPPDDPPAVPAAPSFPPLGRPPSDPHRPRHRYRVADGQQGFERQPDRGHLGSSAARAPRAATHPPLGSVPTTRHPHAPPHH